MTRGSIEREPYVYAATDRFLKAKRFFLSTCMYGRRVDICVYAGCAKYVGRAELL